MELYEQWSSDSCLLYAEEWFVCKCMLEIEQKTTTTIN